MNNKTHLALFKLLDLTCVCGKKLIIEEIADCYKQYILLKAIEENHAAALFGYVIYDIKSKRVIDSFTALTLEETIPKWKDFKRQHNE